MSEARGPSNERHGARRYELRVKGHLDPRWAEWFDGLTLTQAGDGTTVVHGPIVDQAALHGLLQKLRDLGLPLISVARDESEQPEVPSLDLDGQHLPNHGQGDRHD